MGLIEESYRFVSFFGRGRDWTMLRNRTDTSNGKAKMGLVPNNFVSSCVKTRNRGEFQSHKVPVCIAGREIHAFPMQNVEWKMRPIGDEKIVSACGRSR